MSSFGHHTFRRELGAMRTETMPRVHTRSSQKTARVTTPKLLPLIAMTILPYSLSQKQRMEKRFLLWSLSGCRYATTALSPSAHRLAIRSVWLTASSATPHEQPPTEKYGCRRAQ